LGNWVKEKKRTSRIEPAQKNAVTKGPTRPQVSRCYYSNGSGLRNQQGSES